MEAVGLAQSVLTLTLSLFPKSFENPPIKLIYTIDGKEKLEPRGERQVVILTFDAQKNLIFHRGAQLELSFKSSEIPVRVLQTTIGFSDHRSHGSLSLPASNPSDEGLLGGGARLPQPLIRIQGPQDGQSEVLLALEDPNATFGFPRTSCPHCILRITVVLSGRPNAVNFQLSNKYLGKDFKIPTPVSHNYLPENESNVLLWAAAVGDAKLLDTLLRLTKRSVEDITDEAGWSVLLCASFMGRDEVIKHLQGLPEVDWNRTNKKGRTALSWASGNGHISTARLLLTKADANLADKDGLTALDWAAKNGQAGTVDLFLSLENNQEPDFTAELPQELARLARDFRPVTGSLASEVKAFLSLPEHQEAIETPVRASIFELNDKQEWLNKALFEAATRGQLKLTECLIKYGAEIDHSLTGKTPLGIAAEEGHTDVVRYLVFREANLEYPTPMEQTPGRTATGGDTPIFLAIRKGRDKVVKILLDLGADIERSNAASETPLHLAGRHPLILRMLLEKGDNGKLATSTQDLFSETDQLFNATIVNFNSGHKSPIQPSELSVHDLLSEEKHTTLLEDSTSTSFQWYHLPANNMRWVEVLIHKLYKNHLPSSHRILKPDRWAKRQHNGPTMSPHARFMQPLCDLVPNEVDTNLTPIQEQINADKDVVLFMPYLHWDEKAAYIERNAVIKDHDKPIEANWTKERKLLHQYVYDKRNHDLHLMHTRRTLDQFYYHSLKSTEKRDEDQAVSRYQKKYFPNDPKIMTVTDQLWLWVLVGPSRRAQAVISCFPSRPTSELSPNGSRTNESDIHDPLDPKGRTDILQNIKLYLLEESQTVRNPYDLVGVIASKCSGAFLDPSNPPHGLQFAEVYESSISDIMNKDAELFDDFNTALDLRSTVKTATQEMLETWRELQPKTSLGEDVTEALMRTLEKHYTFTKAQEIAMHENINAIIKLPEKEFNAEATRFLQELSASKILDITREIELLRQIKDIQDELNIISMVFENQRLVLERMERIGRSMQSPIFDPATQAPKNINDFASTGPNEQGDETKSLAEDSDQNLYDAQDHIDVQLDPNLGKAEGGTYQGHVQIPSSRGNINTHINHGMVNINSNNDTSITQSVDRDIYNGDIWGASHSPPNSSLPLRVVLQCAKDIERMIQRAERTYKALNFLVDLKQKQSNVMDARATRIEAEASFKMTVESEKQGKVLMIFTVATIVFLPLSFMAAFFALNITEFKRDAGGTLGLGYVSEIMFPVSFAISAIFITFAFKLHSFQKILQWPLKWPWERRGRKDSSPA